MSKYENRAVIYVTGYSYDLNRNRKMLEELVEKLDFCDIVYFEDDNTINDSEIEEILNNVDLILTFVTSKYLYKPNKAHDIIAPYALSHSIPFIPVFLEKYISYDFSEQYPNELYLDPTEDEEVGLSFEQRLSMFVKMMLMVGIQEDFISEKDNPDIISKLINMNRSGIHIRHEYKMALIWESRCMSIARKDYNKQKSESTLQAWIGTCCNLGDFLRFFGYTDEAIHIYNECRKTIENECPHIVYPLLCKLGYTYKNKKDYERAISLFDEASRYADILVKDKNPTALWDMYLIWKVLGDLNFDMHIPEKALIYYDGCSKLLKSCMELSDSPYFVRRLAEVYYCLGETCVKSGKNDDAIKYYEQGINIHKTIITDSSELIDKADVLMGYYNLGNLHSSNRESEKAEQSFKTALNLAEELSAVSESYQTRFNITKIYTFLGDLYTSENCVDLAEDCFHKSLVLSIKYFSESEIFEVQDQLARTYTQMGDIACKRGNDKAALGYQQNSRDIFEKLIKRRDLDHINNNLALVYGRIGDIFKNNDDVPQAAENYIKSLNIYNKVAHRSNNIHARRNAAVTLDQLGDLYLYRQDYENAESSYMQSFDIKNDLLEKADSFEARRDIAVSHLNLGDVYYYNNKIALALEHYEKYLQLMQKLSTGSDSIETERELALAYYKCSKAYLLNDQSRKSKNHLDKAIQLQRIVVSSNVLPSATELLASMYSDMSSLRKKQYQFGEAISFARECLHLREHLNEELKSDYSKDMLASALENAAIIFEEYGDDPEETFSYITRSIDIRVEMADETSKVKDFDKLARLYYNIGVTVALPEMKAAMLKEALSIWEDIVDQTGSSEYQKYVDMTKKAIEYYNFEDIE